MTSAKQKCSILRRSSRKNILARTLSTVGVGLFLVLVSLGAVLYTRAGGSARVYAATSANLNFQARLMNGSGSIVADGDYYVEFKLYNGGTAGGPAGTGQPNAGTLLWTETRTTGNLVKVKGGYLSVNLGSVNTFPSTINWDQELWLTMNIGGAGGSASWDGEMSPRLKLTAVPYAFRSGQADALTNGSGTLGANDLTQLTPSSIQVINSALAALRLNQTGAGLLVQWQGNGSDVFTVSKTGDIASGGDAVFSGGSLTLGDATQSGGLVLSDGSSNSTTLQSGGLSSDLTFTLPTGYGTNGDCLKGNGSGVLSFDACGGGANTFVNNGNAFSGLATLGTTDNYGLKFITNNTQAMLVDTSGNVKIGSGSASEKLDVDGGLRIGNTSNANAGTIRWNGTDFQGYDGSGWVSFTGSGGGSLTINPTANVRKTTDETQNSTVNASATLQNDDQLLFAIGANETWSFRFVLAVNAGTQPDIKFAVTAPSGATCNVGVAEAEGATTIAGLGCGASSGLITGNGAEDIYEVVGTVANGATSGNVTLQWAQNSANATATIIRAGSYLTANRITGGVDSSQAFIQAGNSFGAAAVLGTNDNFGLSLLTNGSSRINILANGNVGIGEANPSALFSVGSGSPFQVNNSGAVTAVGLVSSGALSITSGGASIIGGLNNNTGGITNAGNITGVGTNITASAGLTIASGGSGALTLDSASNVLQISASDTGLQRTAAGSYSIDLNDVSATTLVLNNTSAGAASLNLSDGGLQTAGTTRLNNAGALQNITGLSVISGGASISGNITLGGSSTDRLTVTSQLLGANALVFQGATDNSFTTTLQVADPTANNVIILPNGSGTLVLDSRNILTAAGSGLSGGGNLSADRSLSLDIFGLSTKSAVNPTDYLAVYDDTTSTIKKISRSDLLQGLTGAIQYRGTWNASTNTPALADNTGSEGDEYVVSVAGTRNLGSGSITFNVGDFVIHNGTQWQLAPSSSTVGSVFGRTGAVVAANGDYTASQITNSAAGSIASITVQAAINELDSEKLGSLNGITATSQTFTNDTNVTISSSGTTHSFGWAGQLSVGRGGTGAASFTSNGILYGNNTGALQVTAAGIGGQVLMANSSGVPTFTSLSGDITIDDSGVTTIGANKVDLGTDTTGSYISSLGTLTGLSVTGNSGEGSTPALAVIYGSGANTAVSGNTTLICPSGSGNLSGGGNTITLGIGGTCNSLNTANAVSFSTSVTTPIITSTGGLIISSDASGDITLDSGTNTLIIDDSDTVLQRVAAGTYTIDLKDGSATTLALTNSGAGVANFTADGAITFSGLANCNTIDTNGSGQLVCGTDEGGVGGSGASNLQDAYTGSTTPEITLDGTRGGLTIRDRATTPLGTNLLEIQSNDGNTTYFAVTATGAAVTGTFVSSSTLTVSAGGAVISGGIDNNNGGITEAGALSGITTLSMSGAITGATSTNTINGLVINSGALSSVTGITFTSGSLNLANGGITNSGSITGVGTNITATEGLTITSGGSGALTLDSASNTLILAASDTGLQRTAAGTYTIDLNDSGTTTLTLTNSGSGVANLNLGDGGLVVAGTVQAGTLGSTDTAAYLCRNTSNQLAACSTTAVGTAFAQGGNSFNGLATFGTNDSFDLVFETAGTEKMRIDTAGLMMIGTSATPTLAGADLIVPDAEITGILRIGSATDGIEFSSTGVLYRGTGRPTRRVSLIPEFPGGSMTGDGSNNNGTMSSDYVGGLASGQGHKHSFYEWVTSQGSVQDYDINVVYQLPSDFDGFSSSSFRIWTYLDSATNTNITWTITDTDGTSCYGSVASIKPSTTGTWEEKTPANPNNGCTFAANDIITIKITPTAISPTTNKVRVGEIRFEYLSKF